MSMIAVLHAPPTSEESLKIILPVVKGECPGYLWRDEGVVLGIIGSAFFPQFTQDSDWNSYLSNKFSLVVKPSAIVIGNIVVMKMEVYALNIHFVALELTTLSLQH